jgi:hypothetical protein
MSVAFLGVVSVRGGSLPERILRALDRQVIGMSNHPLYQDDEHADNRPLIRARDRRAAPQPRPSSGRAIG